VEDVAGEALRVNTDEHVLADFAHDEGQMLAAGEGLVVRDRREEAVLGRQLDGDDTLDEHSVRRRCSIRSATVIIRSPCRSQ
jgi:hypothetical protein